MAYMNPYFPAFPSPYAQTPAAAPSAPTGNNVIWVQGEAGAKAHVVAPNTTAWMMDSEQDRFYIKSADASGVPSPLRTFDYTEVTEAPTSGVMYVTREEFDEFKASIAKPSRKAKADEQSV